MRIAISNIAWDIEEDAQVCALLARLGVDAIDIAPGKYFPDPDAAEAAQIERVGLWWRERGVEITGMQALLFGCSGLNMFGPPQVRAAMIARLQSVCRIAGILGARRLVFGSPKNRDRTGLSNEEAVGLATTFFRELGDRAGEHGVTICIEANPTRYGCNFMTTTSEAAEVVRAVDHPAVRLHLDTGTIAINAEDAEEVIARHGKLIGHVHASEPDLVPLGEGGAPHRAVARELHRTRPNGLVSIEMVATKAEPHLESVERALRVAAREYGNTESAGSAA